MAERKTRRKPNLGIHVPTEREKELQAEIDALKLEAEKASEWRMDIRKQVTMADEASKHWKAEADKLREENNSLRGQLFHALMDGERMRGYLDGTVDAEPAAMVPAQRERRLDRYTGTGSADFAAVGGYSAGYGRDRPKAWYER